MARNYSGQVKIRSKQVFGKHIKYILKMDVTRVCSWIIVYAIICIHIWTGFHVCELICMRLLQHFKTGKMFLHKGLF